MVIKITSVLLTCGLLSGCVVYPVDNGYYNNITPNVDVYVPPVNVGIYPPPVNVGVYPSSPIYYNRPIVPYYNRSIVIDRPYYNRPFRPYRPIGPRPYPRPYNRRYY